ncbi:hypothetical protein TB2_024141 [Malus domestica]
MAKNIQRTYNQVRVTLSILQGNVIDTTICLLLAFMTPVSLVAASMIASTLVGLISLLGRTATARGSIKILGLSSSVPLRSASLIRRITLSTVDSFPGNRKPQVGTDILLPGIGVYYPKSPGEELQVVE